MSVVVAAGNIEVLTNSRVPVFSTQRSQTGGYMSTCCAEQQSAGLHTLCSLLMMLGVERCGYCDIRENEKRLSEIVMTPPNTHYTQTSFWSTLKGYVLKKKKKKKDDEEEEKESIPFSFQRPHFTKKLGLMFKNISD